MSHKPADGETAEDVVRSLSSAERKDLQLVPPLCSNDAAFHELVGEEFVPDLFLEDYYRAGIYRRTRGVRREYDMWYRDRVRKWINYFDSDSPPGPVRGWGSRRRTLEIRQDIYRRQHVARPYFEQFLNCAPPDTSRLCNVIKSWMTETVATDEAVVKPFATIGIPDFSG